MKIEVEGEEYTVVVVSELDGTTAIAMGRTLFIADTGSDTRNREIVETMITKQRARNV